ncbi:MAG: hypothetical protein ACOCQW_01915 [Halanaerobiaceae bacterium]
MARKYLMENNSNKKKFYVKVCDFFQEKDAENFIRDYNNIVKKLNPGEYKLIIDSSELKTSSEEIISKLQECLKFYMKDNFSEVIMINPEDSSSRMQLHQLTKSINFTVGFVDSIVNV